MKTALFIFRRDLRLEDNTGLIYALKNAQKVLPCFIFTPTQIEHNPFRSQRCLQFMLESLEELYAELQIKKGKLHLFYGEPEAIVGKIIDEVKIDAVIVNRDYTPYSIHRDQKIETTCSKAGVRFLSFDDALLHPIEDTLKSDNNPYQIFTHYFRNAQKLQVAFIEKNRQQNYYTEPISFAQDPSLFQKIFPKRLNQQKGGRKNALKILNNLEKFSDYTAKRDFPAANKTTHLSPHLKFTTCSVREAYHAIAKKLGQESGLIRSLYWRDFFTSIAFYFPHVFNQSFKKNYPSNSWKNNEKDFRMWCEGKTGVPIIDAGMHELLQTGFIHNRVRMLVASFLVKNLQIDWRWGEKFFAQHLIDYDPAVNNGNWQWVAGTGCDAQPYFRVFNPWTQATKFDPDNLYINKWTKTSGTLNDEC